MSAAEEKGEDGDSMTNLVTYMPLDFSHRHHHLSLLSSSRQQVSEKVVMLSSSFSEHARLSLEIEKMDLLQTYRMVVLSEK